MLTRAPRLVLVLPACALAVFESRALAQQAPAHVEHHPTAVLEYSVAPQAASLCPDEASVRASVAQRLGYDPFAASSTIVRAAITPRGRRGMRARIEVLHDGARSGDAREIPASGRDCEELARAMTLAISIAIDPL